jgi:GH25 family lysozyme M1 (1,4-beta-N-acetylmuramidase)
MTVKGIDVSSYQSAAYSTKGLDFVFVKAAEGTSYINPRMTAQAAHARRNGLVVGFYDFLRPGDMAAQAAYFVDLGSAVS